MIPSSGSKMLDLHSLGTYELSKFSCVCVEVAWGFVRVVWLLFTGEGEQKLGPALVSFLESPRSSIVHIGNRSFIAPLDIYLALASLLKVLSMHTSSPARFFAVCCVRSSHVNAASTSSPYPSRWWFGELKGHLLSFSRCARLLRCPAQLDRLAISRL